MSGTRSRVASRSISFGPRLRAALNDVLGGGAASVLTVSFGLSYSLLIFAGPLAPYLSYGVAVTFVSSAVLATVIALGSSLPFAIGGPESSTAAVTAILASSLVERMALADTTAPQLAPVLITLGLSTIVTGIVLCGFGVTRMGRAIRYVPSTVVGGFLGATGCLLIFGAIRVIAGQRLELATLDRFANMLTLSELAAACAMALVLYLTWHRSRSAFGLPVILIGGIVFAHVAFWFAGISLADAQAAGWTFESPPHVSLMLPWSLHEISRHPWYTLPDLLGNVIAVIFVTAISTLSTPPASRSPRNAKPISNEN
jgi:SulP family sulfate permease